MSKNRYQHFSCLRFGSRSDVDDDNILSGLSQFGCIYMTILLKNRYNFFREISKFL